MIHKIKSKPECVNTIDCFWHIFAVVNVGCFWIKYLKKNEGYKCLSQFFSSALSLSLTSLQLSLPLTQSFPQFIFTFSYPLLSSDSLLLSFSHTISLSFLMSVAFFLPHYLSSCFNIIIFHLQPALPYYSPLTFQSSTISLNHSHIFYRLYCLFTLSISFSISSTLSLQFSTMSVIPCLLFCVTSFGQTLNLNPFR